jgi:hypothetical protein
MPNDGYGQGNLKGVNLTMLITCTSMLEIKMQCYLSMN